MGPPMPQYGARPPMPPPGGVRPRMPLPPMHGPVPGPMHGTMMRQWLPPPPGSIPMRPGMMPPRPPPIFRPRGPGVPRTPMWSAPMGPRPMMGGPGMRPRGMMPAHMQPRMRIRFRAHNQNGMKVKATNNAKKNNKIEEVALKKAWMTDEICNEIKRKNKLYAKASKNKVAKEWEEFKDLRNKVTRMIRDAKNEYNAKNANKGQESEGNEDEVNDEEMNENFNGNPDQESDCSNNYECYEGEMEFEEPEPDVVSHYCEICDREFISAERLQEHISTHEVCGIDGCTFTANPKLVQKHYTMQHATGLFQRMKDLSSAEDIEKWIIERKTRYPTKENMDKKMAEKLEEEKKQEVEEKKQSKNDKGNVRSRAKERRRNKGKKDKEQKTKCNISEETPELIYKGLKMFKGIESLLNTIKSDDEGSDTEQSFEEELISNIHISDDDEELDLNIHISDKNEENDKPQQRFVPSPSHVSDNLNSLSLLSMYESDSESDEPPEELPIEKIKIECPLSLKRINSKIDGIADENLVTENSKKKQRVEK